MRSRPFAYNPSLTPIPGTQQIGTLAVGVDQLDYSSNPGGVTWWMGPDEDAGYIIGSAVPDGDQPTPLGDIGTVAFWKTDFFRNNNFVQTVNHIFGQTFEDEITAKSWLTTNGHWTSWDGKFRYDTQTMRAWAPVTGYTLYTDGFTSLDDGYNLVPITIPEFHMNGTGFTSLYVSTNGYVTLGTGYGDIITTPQQYPGHAAIAGNPGDQWLQSGLVMDDGDTQNLYYRILDEGSMVGIEILVHIGSYNEPLTPKSYLIGLYRDLENQWIETRVKINATGHAGPYNITDVSRPSSTSSQVWKGDLNGQNWEYLGAGEVIK